MNTFSRVAFAKESQASSDPRSADMKVMRIFFWTLVYSIRASADSSYRVSNQIFMGDRPLMGIRKTLDHKKSYRGKLS